MLLSRCLASAAWLALAGPAAAQIPFQVDHAPPACLLAEKVPRVVACLTPRSARASVRVLFRAEGEAAWYAAPLRFENPCYAGVLPRPSRTTGAVAYVVEAEGTGVTARSAERTLPVAADAAACPGRPASVAEGVRAAWQAPAGAPRIPPGFEGTRAGTARASAPAPPVAAPPTTARAPAPARPQPKGTPAPTPPPRPTAQGGGHGARNTLLVLAGAAAAGGAAVAATREPSSPQTPATTLGTGLPAGGVAGVYVGTESVSYSAACTGIDDVVLNLQGAGPLVSGVLTFTVRSCPCCASGRGATPLTGSLSGTRLQLETTVGFLYSGSFAGNRLSGSLTGPGGVTGTWTVDKR